MILREAYIQKKQSDKYVSLKVPRPPKSGKSISANPVSKYCKGLCEALRDNPRVGPKKYYLKGGLHVYCTKCDVWMKQEAMKWNGRCPCCNYRPRYK